MKRVFIETDDFKTLVTQEKLRDLEKDIKDEILKGPSKGDLIPGTGGFRKIRVANKVRKTGKSGSFRVIYLDLPRSKRTYLVFLYKKDELENLSSEQKSVLKTIAEGIKNEQKS